MFLSKVPRVFLLAGLALLCLVLGTSYYLYDAEPDYPSGISGSPGVAYHNGHTQAPEEGLDLAQSSGGLSESVSSVAAQPVSIPTEVPGPVPVPDNDDQPNPEQELSDPEPTTAPEPEPSDEPEPTLRPGQCQPELDFLKKSHSENSFTERVLYTRRCIQPDFSSTVDRNAVANISDALVANGLTFDIDNCEDVKLPRCHPIKLSVPPPYPQADFSHLIFGVATDYDRLGSLLDSFTHWLSGSGSKLVVVLTDINAHTTDEVDDLEQQFKAAGIDFSIEKPFDDEHTVSQSHFAVLLYLLDHSNDDTRWYGLIDDDTFFPSLRPLSDALDTVDYKVDAYVGALSEDFDAVRTFGFMAFGGAGAYLSPALARKLGGEVLNCIGDADMTEGDIIIRDCVYRHSRAKLTILPGLYQQDLREDASGFFESGVRAINFHHWMSWYQEPVVKMSAAATYCGDCLLQRWRFGDDTVFSNGYSVVEYPNGMENIDLGRMEGTWRNANEDFDFSIGPLRDRLEQGDKKTYKLIDVDVNEDGDLKQLYIWKGEDDDDSHEVDEIIELVWQKK